jgi:hypothetical protein
VIPVATHGTPGFNAHDVAWLLDNASGEIVVLRPGTRPAKHGRYVIKGPIEAVPGTGSSTGDGAAARPVRSEQASRRGARHRARAGATLREIDVRQRERGNERNPVAFAFLEHVLAATSVRL